MDFKQYIKQLFERADGLAILAGAGMSVESGIPDFRGDSGLWTAVKENFMKFSSANSFHQHPVDSWNFYISRMIKYRDCEPHEGYHLLKNLHSDIFVVTSNVDDLFQRAGYTTDKIFEIHGNLKHIQCSHGCCRVIRDMPLFTETIKEADDLPHCHECGSVMRPVVMMFNDPWFLQIMTEQQSKIFRNWTDSKKNILGIEIGAGRAVPSIRIMANERTNTLIRINPHDYSVDREQDISVESTAVDGIKALIKILQD